MPRSKLFSERLDEQISRLDNLEVGGREQRTLGSISKELSKIMERLVITEGPDGKGISRKRVSKIAKEDRVPSDYQKFVTRMSSELLSTFPTFTLRSKEIGRLWKIQKKRMGMGSDNSDYSDDDSEGPQDVQLRRTISRKKKSPSAKPKKASKATKATKAKKVTKGGFYENAYDYNFF